MVSETEGVLRLVVTFGLTFVLGFERQLRGSPAGNRTFSLIGLGAAVIGLLSESAAPNALAGAVTGIGFIGAGLVFRQKEGRGEVVRGVTTAAAIFATAAIGAAAGRAPPHRHHRNRPRAGVAGVAARPGPESVGRRPLRVPVRPGQSATTTPSGHHTPAVAQHLGVRPRW